MREDLVGCAAQSIWLLQGGLLLVLLVACANVSNPLLTCDGATPLGELGAVPVNIPVLVAAVTLTMVAAILVGHTPLGGGKRHAHRNAMHGLTRS
jgi:hypothetical protein